MSITQLAQMCVFLTALNSKLALGETEFGHGLV